MHRSVRSLVYMGVNVEEATWGELRARMRSFVAGRVGDSSVHDDLAQEILFRVHKSLPTLRDSARLDAFAYQIARNAIADHHRRSHRELPMSPETFDERRAAEDEDDPDGSGRAQLARCLRPLVDRLADPYREALLLTDLGELSQAAAAHQLGLSEPGMRSRVQRGRVQAADALAQCCHVGLDAADQIDIIERVGPCACSS